MQLPNFLNLKEANKRIIAIDFGASFIKIVHLEKRGDKFALLSFALKEIKGTQKSGEEIGAYLKEILKAKSIKTKGAYLSISDPEQIFIKKLSLPMMSRDELFNAIKWQLKGEFAFSPDESIADLQIVREYTDSEAARKIELFCIFVKKELINNYLLISSAAGLSPLKISSSAFNYYEILNSITANPRICAILDIGHTQSRVLIYQNNKLNFTRNINFSISKLSASLIQTLVTDKGKVEIGSEKADQIMHQYGIILDESVKIDAGIKASQIIPLMRPLLEILIKELERSFDFFKSESALGGPEILYLSGGGANLNNLITYLSEQSKIKVEKLPFPDSLDIKNVNQDEFLLDSSQLSSAIGLGLSESGINLLPPEVKSQKAELIQKSTLRIAAIAISGIFIFSWFTVNFQIGDYKKRLKIAKLHLENVEEIKNLKQTVDSREDYTNRIHNGKVPSGGLLKLVGAIIPANIILNEFDFDQLSHSMHLKGIITTSNDSVEKMLTDFMNSLEASSFIIDANLISSKDDQGVHNFEIECALAK